MKYTPKELTENVNVPRVSPLRELGVLLGGVLALALAAYLLLGWLVDVVVSRLSPRLQIKLEEKLSPVFAGFYSNRTEFVGAEAELQRLLEALQRGSDLTQSTYRVHLVDNSTVNAVALPGGHIVVFAGLAAAAESENELAMVLGHELGHFAHRDHLCGLGRGLVFLTITTVLLGGDDPVSRVLQTSLANAELRFSRRQELAADRLGLELVVKHYGHAGGCTDFFARVEREKKQARWTSFLLTHPVPGRRVAILEDHIRQKNYRQGVKQPVAASVREIEVPRLGDP